MICVFDEFGAKQLKANIVLRKFTFTIIFSARKDVVAALTITIIISAKTLVRIPVFQTVCLKEPQVRSDSR